jgi:hypothetical protein
MHHITRRSLSGLAIFILLLAVFVPSVSADHISSCLGMDGLSFTNAGSAFYVSAVAGTNERASVTITSDSHPNEIVSVLEFGSSGITNLGNFALPLTFNAENDERHDFLLQTISHVTISYTRTYSCKVPPGPPCFESDARINNDDCGALVALYQDGTFIDAYGIDPASGEGVLVFRFDLSTAGDVTENTLIAEGTNPFNGQPIRLYKLAGGGYQVNTTQPNGEPYAFSWS